MKTVFTYISITCVLFAFPQRIKDVNVSLVNSQNQGTNSQVLIRFTLTAGQTCPGYEILRSTDSIFYSTIWTYGNVCGNQNTDESHNYTDGVPAIEMTNYYKVSIPGFETSPAYRIYVTQQAPKPNITVYPNPAFTQDFVRLRFYNYAGAKVEGYIYNQYGKPIKSLYLDITLNESQMNIGELSDGLYIVWLTDGNWLFRSKFIVKRT